MEVVMPTEEQIQRVMEVIGTDDRPYAEWLATIAYDEDVEGDIVELDEDDEAN